MKYSGLINKSCLVLLLMGGLAVHSLHAQATGGSNYGWYQVDGCNLEDPYGVIKNYNLQTSLINNQLQTMFNNGQRRLRLPIFHGRVEYGGTVMSSVGGNLSTQMRQNLTNLLAEIRSIGYSEIEVGFFPAGDNSPASWTQYSEDYYQENWNVIYNLHSIIAGAGIAYRIDLLNEGTPASNQPAMLQYAQHLWADYNFVFGKSDTVGFSIIPSTDRLSQIPSVYGVSQYDPGGTNGYPYVYDLHFYANANANFQNAVTALNGQGYNPGWIIGESYYNDPAEALALRQAINSTGHSVFYLTQWPLTSSSGCSDVDTAPPASFSSYQSQSF